MKSLRQILADPQNASAIGRFTSSALILTCFAVGVLAVAWAAADVAQQQRMKSWVEVPATITHVSLNEDGDGAQETLSAYEYEFKGKKFTGRRVGVNQMGGGDNIGDFQHQVFCELKQHLDQHQPFRCYVNPSDPSQAVLYRQLRWGLFFFLTSMGLIFCAIGAGLLAARVASGGRSRASKPDGLPDREDAT